MLVVILGIALWTLIFASRLFFRLRVFLLSQRDKLDDKLQKWELEFKLENQDFDFRWGRLARRKWYNPFVIAENLPDIGWVILIGISLVLREVVPFAKRIWGFFASKIKKDISKPR